MDGGFRGSIRIVPELPIGPHRKHLEAIVEAQRASARLYAELERRAGVPLPYRQRALGWRFFRSVGRTTPSAYAGGWEVGFNVSGSLHSSAQAVLETIVHEVFHLNDQAHGAWSRRVLGPISDALVARCGTRIDCLRPHAPMKTLVRGGTYYAFQPGNGDSAHEYAAELATRYFLEQRCALEGHDSAAADAGRGARSLQVRPRAERRGLALARRRVLRRRRSHRPLRLSVDAFIEAPIDAPAGRW
jgi:hypothetical protein